MNGHQPPSGAALHSLRHLPLATRLAAGAFYGIAAGLLLLHDDARLAALAMVAIWLATVWRPTSSRTGTARKKRSLAKSAKEDEKKWNG